MGTPKAPGTAIATQYGDTATRVHALRHTSARRPHRSGRRQDETVEAAARGSISPPLRSPGRLCGAVLRCYEARRGVGHPRPPGTAIAPTADTRELCGTYP